MKKFIIICLSVLVVAVAGIGIYAFFFNNQGNTRVENDKAERDEKGRYLTVINSTGQVINEVHIAVGDGTEIESCEQRNPDEESFSVEIPEEYKEYKTFKVTFIDRYGMKYEKKVDDVSDSGRTEINLSEDDYIKQSGDFKRKINRFFNGD